MWSSSYRRVWSTFGFYPEKHIATISTSLAIWIHVSKKSVPVCSFDTVWFNHEEEKRFHWSHSSDCTLMCWGSNRSFGCQQVPQAGLQRFLTDGFCGSPFSTGASVVNGFDYWPCGYGPGEEEEEEVVEVVEEVEADAEDAEDDDEGEAEEEGEDEAEEEGEEEEIERGHMGVLETREIPSNKRVSLSLQQQVLTIWKMLMWTLTLFGEAPFFETSAHRKASDSSAVVFLASCNATSQISWKCHECQTNLKKESCTSATKTTTTTTTTTTTNLNIRRCCRPKSAPIFRVQEKPQTDVEELESDLVLQFLNTLLVSLRVQVPPEKGFNPPKPP